VIVIVQSPPTESGEDGTASLQPSSGTRSLLK
jgi:hypothetical protein